MRFSTFALGMVFIAVSGCEEETVTSDDDLVGDDDTTEVQGDDDTAVDGVEGVSLALADARLLGASPGDHAGSSIAAAGDMNGDGFDDVLIGADGASTAGEDAGAVYLVHGPMHGDLDLSVATASLLGAAGGSAAGAAVSSAGDVDGDGRRDVLVGASGHSGYATDAGAAYVVRGPLVGDLPLGAADTILLGREASDRAGSSVAGGCDIDGDGLGDVVIGAIQDNANGTWAGAAYVVYAPEPGTRDLGTADAILLGERSMDRAGSSMSCAGDIDCDGHDDLLVGAMGADGGKNWGAAYLVYGPVEGTFDLGMVGTRLDGEDSGDHAGIAVALTPDVSGDHVDDLLIGAKYTDHGTLNGGSAYLFHEALVEDQTLAAANAVMIGETSHDYAGNSVAAAGDVDGDGLADILIGASGVSGGPTMLGAAYLVTSTLADEFDLAAAHRKWIGEADNDWAGWAVSSAGDADGDGLHDILIAAPRQDANGEDAGTVYLVYGAGI